MSLPVRTQLKYWGFAAAGLFVVLYLLGNVILPFVLGGALAYVLNPIVDKLHKIGLNRAVATAIIMLLGLVVFVLIVLLVVPTLTNQMIGLAQMAPELVQRFQAAATEHFPSILDEGSTLRKSLNSLVDMLQSRGATLVQGILNSAIGVVNVVVLLILVPVITFYLLLDWNRLIANVDRLLPREHAGVIRKLALEIDHTLASFIRGQGLVCLILGVFYAVALAMVGLNFGLIVGALAGALTFIPYVGALTGGLLAVGLALFQFWGEWWWIVAVYAIFQFGQFVEGNILTPKLVGESVGLHPVWLLFALSAFGALFGFVGLLVAVPVAAVLGVISRFLIERYQESPLYRGTSEPDPEP